MQKVGNILTEIMCYSLRSFTQQGISKFSISKKNKMKLLNISKNKIKYFIKSAFSLLIAIVAFIASVPAQAQSGGTQQIWFSTSETENIITPLTEFNTPATNEEFTLYVIYNDFDIVNGATRVGFGVYWNNNILEHINPAEVTSAGMIPSINPHDTNLIISAPEGEHPTPFSGAQSDGISDGDPETDYAIIPAYANLFGSIFPDPPVAIIRMRFRWRADATEGATNTMVNLAFSSFPLFNAPNREVTNLVINAPSTNVAPTASAGDTQTVNEGDTVRLDGSLSTDNVAIDSYGWSSSVPTLTLTNADAEIASFIAPEVDTAGLDIILTLTVTDTAGLTDSATVLVRVNNVVPDTEAPVASAGEPQTVNEGDTVRLDAGLSTDNVAIDSYGWSSEIPTLTLTNADAEVASFTAPEVEEAGLEIILTLTVTDTAGLTDSATVLITVNNVPDTEAPVASAGEPQTVNEGDTVRLDGGLSTDNIGIDSYGWSSEIPTLALTNADAEVASFIAPEVEEAGLEIILTLTVTDTAGLTDSATVLITVNNVVVPDTEAPVASAGEPQTVNEGDTVRLDAGLSTDNVGIDSYGWSSEPTLTLTNADAEVASFIAPEVEEAGLEIILTLTVTDTAGLTDSATVLITVNNVVVPDLDVDEDGNITINDFIMMVRYGFAIRGADLTSALSGTSPEIVEANIQNIISNTRLDVDEDGNITINDFIMMIRYGFGIRGNDLTSALSGTSPEIVENNIRALLP